MNSKKHDMHSVRVTDFGSEISVSDYSKCLIRLKQANGLRKQVKNIQII